MKKEKKSGSVSPLTEKRGLTKAAFTVCLNNITGKKVVLPDGKVLGRFVDVMVDLAFSRPKIVAAVISFKKQQKTIDFKNIEISEFKGKYHLFCKEIKTVETEGLVRLAGEFLNKQVVDTNKKRTVTIYDFKIAVVNSEATVIAVDAGLQGRLRRLGIDELVRKFLKLFDITLTNQLILWDNIELINIGQEGADFSKSIKKLDRLHPSDMADIIEELDDDTQAKVFSNLGTERAADVMEELESDTRESLLGSLPTEKMADVLESMPADEAADILDNIDEKKAEKLLEEMSAETSDKVRDLLEYEDYEVGSLMTTDFVCFGKDDTVGATLEVLRREKPESDMIYYLYIVSENGELQAEVSLRDFIVSVPGIKLSDIMNKDVRYVYDTDRIESLSDLITKYDLLAVPVVNLEKKLVGIVIINDVIYALLHSKRKRL
jgi:CBS domain-containing protein/sporulation protein YlmC with PRC-barrel domain